MGKLKRVEAHLRATLSRITKMAIGGGVTVKPRTTFPLPRRENIPKTARRERGKERILILPHQLPVQHQTVIHLTMNQRSNYSRWYLRTNGTNVKYRNQWLPLQINIFSCTSQTRSYTQMILPYQYWKIGVGLPAMNCLIKTRSRKKSK